MKQPTIVIEGRNPISGSVRISGAKNAALPELAAVALSSEPFSFANIPQVEDIKVIYQALLGNRRRRPIRRQPGPDPHRRMPRGRRPHRNRPNDPRLDPASRPAVGPERLRQGFFSRRLFDRRAEDQLSPRWPRTDGRSHRNRRGVHRRPQRPAPGHRIRLPQQDGHRDGKPVDGRHPRRGDQRIAQLRPGTGNRRSRRSSPQDGGGDSGKGDRNSRNHGQEIACRRRSRRDPRPDRGGNVSSSPEAFPETP